MVGAPYSLGAGIPAESSQRDGWCGSADARQRRSCTRRRRARLLQTSPVDRILIRCAAGARTSHRAPEGFIDRAGVFREMIVRRAIRSAALSTAVALSLACGGRICD
jgi:hypothetical protein